MRVSLVQSVEKLFVEHVESWLRENHSARLALRSSAMVFSEAVTAWMMLSQKALGSETLTDAIKHLRDASSADGVAGWLQDSKRYRLGTISPNPGGLSQARERLKLEFVEQLCEHLSSKAEAEHREYSKLHGRQFYILDGSTIELQDTASIREEFIPQSNDRGVQRPAARITVAHNVVTAIALPPEIGSISESEQSQAARLIKRMGRKSVIIGDQNFGVFSVAWAAHQAKQESLIRLQEIRAQRLLQKEEIPSDAEYQIVWTPSQKEQQKHEFPEKASVPGRIIFVTPTIPGCRCERLIFFTTIPDLSPQQIAAIYRMRWSIEQDLRTIKHSVNLDIVYSKSADVAKKEILLGVAAYTLIRALIARATKELGLQPRDVSFTRSVQNIEVAVVRIARAKTRAERLREYDLFLNSMRQAKHPNRSKPRVEPRALAGKTRKTFPALKGTRHDARSKIISNLEA